jgi:hypothetical protein
MERKVPSKLLQCFLLTLNERLRTIKRPRFTLDDLAGLDPYKAAVNVAPNKYEIDITLWLIKCMFLSLSLIWRVYGMFKKRLFKMDVSEYVDITNVETKTSHGKIKCKDMKQLQTSRFYDCGRAQN